MAVKFKKDQKVYDAEGRCFIYMGKIDGCDFVYSHFEEERYGGADPFHHWKPLYATPPKQVYAEPIAAAKAELQSLTDEIKASKEQLIELENAKSKYKEIQLLIDYLEGRVTHVVEARKNHDVVIREFNDDFLLQKESSSAWGGGREESWPKAIGLFAVPNSAKGDRWERRTVTWKASRYNDGGEWGTFTPCRSEEEARDVVRMILDRKLQNWRQDRNKQAQVNLVLRHNPWLELPEDWKGFLKEIQEQNRKQKNASLEEERQRIVLRLNDIDKILKEEAF